MTSPIQRRWASGCLGVLALTMPACSGLDVVNAVSPGGNSTRTANIPYGEGPRRKLDIYVPRNTPSNPAGTRVVIFFYGGNWKGGSRADYRFVAQALTSRGFIGVLPDYRLYPEVTFPAFVRDGAAAVRWVHDHAAAFGGDPGHIYLAGHSAGAHIAALLTLDQRYLAEVGLDRNVIKGTVGIAGPYDFVVGPKLRPVFNAPTPASPLDPAMQPITFADGTSPPMLLLQGRRDKVVDPGNATRLAARITERGGHARTVFYPRRGHVGILLAIARPFRWLDDVVEEMGRFFRER